MPVLPEKDQQIRQTHAALINQVARACQNRDAAQELEPALREASKNGWTNLVGAIRSLLAGRRDTAILNGLDDEDRIIVEAILMGLQDPSTLPDPHVKPDPAAAAPGLASIIHAARRGEVGALAQLGQMAEMMQRAGGDMARLGGCLRGLVDGEGDFERQRRGMDPATENLLRRVMEELERMTHAS